MKETIKRIPVIGPLARATYARLRGGPDTQAEFRGSSSYWEKRYTAGGNSGSGSYGKFAEFKAEVLNAFVEEHQVQSVIEYGCGDGNQLKLASYPRYLGFDVSETAIQQCRRAFGPDPTKHFMTVQEYSGETADLTLSLDVIYHLVEDEVFDRYMDQLFRSSERYVIIYASNTDDNCENHDPHVRHRAFGRWVSENANGWRLAQHIPNRYPYEGDYTEGSFADFYIYAKD